MTAAQFCQLEGVSQTSFNKWKKKLRELSQQPSPRSMPPEVSFASVGSGGKRSTPNHSARTAGTNADKRQTESESAAPDAANKKSRQPRKFNWGCCTVTDKPVLDTSIFVCGRLPFLVGNFLSLSFPFFPWRARSNRTSSSSEGWSWV